MLETQLLCACMVKVAMVHRCHRSVIVKPGILSKKWTGSTSLLARDWLMVLGPSLANRWGCGACCQHLLVCSPVVHQKLIFNINLSFHLFVLIWSSKFRFFRSKGDCSLLKNTEMSYKYPIYLLKDVLGWKEHWAHALTLLKTSTDLACFYMSVFFSLKLST